MCVCMHIRISLYFPSVWLLENSVYMAFLGWWPYKSFESQLVFEHLKCSRQGSLHISERKAVTNTELYWKRSQMLMENINVIQEKFCIYILRSFFVSNSYMWLHFFSSCRCPLPRKYDWNVRNEKLINSLYSSFGSCRFSNGFICL